MSKAVNNKNGKKTSKEANTNASKKINQKGNKKNNNINTSKQSELKKKNNISKNNINNQNQNNDEKIILTENKNDSNEEIKKPKNTYKILFFSLLCIGIILGSASLCIMFKQHRLIGKYKHDVKSLLVIKKNYLRDECKTKNALKKLKIVSSYGDDEAYHPKVIYFKDKFGGYKYWMAYTPYPHADDAKENPHIAASNDMKKWEEPKEYKNPLEPAPDNFKVGDIYNSDTHILYNSDTEELEVWWRYVNNEDKSVIIYRKTSKNGVDWSDKEVVIKNIRRKKDYLSPAVIYEDGKYKMWYVSGRKRVEYIESDNLKDWSEPKDLNIDYSNKELKSWHLDVIHTDNGYEMVVSAFIKNERNRMNLYYSKSDDNENWSNPEIILTPSFATDNWDNRGIYRSSLLKVDDKYYLFYSGISNTGERGVGLITGQNVNNLCYSE